MFSLGFNKAMEIHSIKPFGKILRLPRDSNPGPSTLVSQVEHLCNFAMVNPYVLHILTLRRYQYKITSIIVQFI